MAAYGTLADKGVIDDAGGGLHKRWLAAHPDKTENDSPYSLAKVKSIKEEYEKNAESAKKKYTELFYYFDGLLGTIVSQSVHPAGMVISPIVLDNSYGIFHKDGERCLLLTMDDAHDCGMCKYDLLILKTVGVINDTCKLIGREYPRTHEINFNDQAVWDDLIRSQLGVFQMEAEYLGTYLRQFKPQNIFDLSLVTAAIRPSGASYRDDLMARKVHKNPSKQIDDLLKDDLGFLVYQEKIIAFLQQICGLTGSEADTIRRGIAKKKLDLLQEWMPKILDGYCANSDEPREIAERQCSEYIQIVVDASSYMFGYNHSIAYCLMSYYCVYFRHYYPAQFITAFLNNAANDDDIAHGTEMAALYNIKIERPTFGLSGENYTISADGKTISKGISSIKFLNEDVAKQLLEVSKTVEKDAPFVSALDAVSQTSINSRQLDILIKLDYFREYGNSTELTAINWYYEFLEGGKKQQLKKESIEKTPLPDFIQEYATDIGKQGNTLKSYKITDGAGLLKRCEQYVRDSHMHDADFRQKCEWQEEYLGYIDLTTGKKEDRQKLFIRDVYPLRSKKDGSTWAYVALTRSVGTGKNSRMTVREWLYKAEPFMKHDIIRVTDYHPEKGYWYLDGYKVLV